MGLSGKNGPFEKKLTKKKTELVFLLFKQYWYLY